MLDDVLDAPVDIQLFLVDALSNLQFVLGVIGNAGRKMLPGGNRELCRAVAQLGDIAGAVGNIDGIELVLTFRKGRDYFIGQEGVDGCFLVSAQAALRGRGKALEFLLLLLELKVMLPQGLNQLFLLMLL